MTVELPILGFLKEKPMHGYDLKRRLDAILGFVWQPSYGSLYPMLRKLEERGLVNKEAGPKGLGPQKQVYRLTAEGERRLRELLMGDEPGTNLHLKMLFFAQLSPGDRKSILEKERMRRAETLKRLEGESIQRLEGLNKYQRLLLDHGLANLRGEIDWLDELIRQEDESDE